MKRFEVTIFGDQSLLDNLRSELYLDRYKSTEYQGYTGTTLRLMGIFKRNWIGWQTGYVDIRPTISEERAPSKSIALKLTFSKRSDVEKVLDRLLTRYGYTHTEIVEYSYILESQ